MLGEEVPVGNLTVQNSASACEKDPFIPGGQIHEERGLKKQRLQEDQKRQKPQSQIACPIPRETG